MRNLLHRATCVAALIFVTLWVAGSAAYAGVVKVALDHHDGSVLLSQTAKVSMHRRAVLDDGLCEDGSQSAPGWFEDSWGLEDNWADLSDTPSSHGLMAVRHAPTQQEPGSVRSRIAAPSLLDALNATEQLEMCDLGWFAEQLNQFGLTLPHGQCALLLEELLERTVCSAAQEEGCATQAGGLPPPASRGVSGSGLGSGATSCVLGTGTLATLDSDDLGSTAFLGGRSPWLLSTELISRIERPPESFGH